jgi:deoxyribose-phosphate aldolase
VLEKYLSEHRYKRLEELLSDIALGNRMPVQVAQELARAPGQGAGRAASEDNIHLTGAERGVITYAACCHPLPGDPTIPHVAAICVYPTFVAEAKAALGTSGVKVASVATAFPSGQTFLDVKLAEVRTAVAAGADEIDMVIDRGAFLAGDYGAVFEEIVAVREAAGEAHLKVILETGELGTYDNVRRASVLAMAAGADFIKTSTGKITPAATLPVTLVMLEAIRDFERATGKVIGMKPAGGIKTAKESIQYLVVLYETLGPRWMTPDLFRFGASSLLNDVLMQVEKERTGAYQRPDHFTLD